jgi:glutathione S-transferase
MYHFTALVTLAAVLFYFFTSTRVARARVAHGVKLPAIRAIRISNACSACR